MMREHPSNRWEQSTKDYFDAIGVNYQTLEHGGACPDGVINGRLFVEITGRDVPAQLNINSAEERLCRVITPKLERLGLALELVPQDGSRIFDGDWSKQDIDNLLSKAKKLRTISDHFTPEDFTLKWHEREFAIIVGNWKSERTAHHGHDSCGISVRSSVIRDHTKTLDSICKALAKKYDQHRQRTQFHPYIVVLHDHYSIFFDDEAERIIGKCWPNRDRHVAAVLVFHHPDTKVSSLVLIPNPQHASLEIKEIFEQQLNDGLITLRSGR